MRIILLKYFHKKKLLTPTLQTLLTTYSNRALFTLAYAKSGLLRFARKPNYCFFHPAETNPTVSCYSSHFQWEFIQHITDNFIPLSEYIWRKLIESTELMV